MESVVLQYAPKYWDRNFNNTRVRLVKTSEEFIKIEQEIKRATKNRVLINFIERNQNIQDLGQVLVREQQKIATTNSNKEYYRVRRYTALDKQYLHIALKHNLDYRRCGQPYLRLGKYVNFTHNDIIFVVQVITDSPDEEYIVPTNSSDYFIDYIVDGSF